eukprot:1859038-Heterocapsa_arctica.AAC.1
MIYIWKWDNRKTPHEIHNYGRDGCTRWYPGKGFCRTWDPTEEDDPGMRGFIDMHKNIFIDDTSAADTRSHNFMIGLMADDIENAPGYNRLAPRMPDEM